MNELKDKLIRFREVTLNVIDSLEKEDYDSPEALLNHRENIIKEIKTLKYNKEEFKKINEELKLMIIEKKLNDLMASKKEALKLRLKESTEMKNANQNYAIKQFGNDNILDTKI